MPDLYDIITSERVSVTLTPELAEDGQDALIQSKPSGVQFHVVVVVNEETFADPDRLGRAIAGVAVPYAGYFNEDVNHPGVRSISTYQDFDANNNLVSRLLVTVRSDDGLATTEVTAPLTDAIPERFAALIEPIHAALNELDTVGATSYPPV